MNKNENKTMQENMLWNMQEQMASFHDDMMKDTFA